jgi:hypothetical protein
MTKRTIYYASVTTILALGPVLIPSQATAASTTGGTRSHGLGFCIRALAQDPSLAGADHFGTAVAATATSGPGAVPAALEDIRYPVCGGPGAVE